MDSETIKKVLDTLEETYPDAKCALEHVNTFELLVATMLSAQTTDQRVNMVSPELFSAYPDAESMAQADPEDVGRIIKSIGIYRNKAKNIVAMSKVLMDEYDGKVPGIQEELVKLPGVGRKTANVVLADGFGVQRIAVDTHVFRVANRIGLADSDNVLGTEEQLMASIPEERWTRTHHAVIFHGRRCCHARKPNCGECPISAYCRYYSSSSK